MNDIIKKIITRLSGDKKMAGMVFAVLALTVFGTAFASKNVFNQRAMQASVALSMEDSDDSSKMRGVATVGAEIATGTESPGSSWSGEIVSLGNIPIQPQREGTIVEWRVKIGQWVNEGQTLGKLSPPPATPELISMLADKAELLARARAQATTTEIFTEKTIEQLKTLSSSFEKEASGVQIKNTVSAQKQNVRVFIDQILFKHGSVASNATTPSSFRFGSLNRQYGQLDQSNQNAYELAFMRLAKELNNPDVFPFDSAREYLAVAVRLANTTQESSEITDIRTMMREDQEKFLTMLAEITTTEIEYKTMWREINEKIADNERLRAMSRAEVKAAEASYATVERSINGGLFIPAPRSGVISTITKKVGEFVGPGMPVASLNTGNIGERFVRFSIPSNVKLPKIGSTLSVVRPGFSQDIQNVKVFGIGTSLDTTGAYMADATFLTPVDWPVNASVRVIAPQSSRDPIIEISSVWWSEEGVPHVWGVSEGGRIFAKKIIIGRTLGASIEVYEGLKNGDRYIISPTADIYEGVLLDDTIKDPVSKDGAATFPAKSGGHENMPGM
ncbi:MAG: hypothetical protein Q7S11_02365 [bacterium]|nr:hypothetical protein [bacterium]